MSSVPPIARVRQPWSNETAEWPSQLEWFEYEYDPDLPTYSLTSELTDEYRHTVSSDDGEWLIDPIQPPKGSMTVMEALTYLEELHRLVIAASFLNANEVTA